MDVLLIGYGAIGRTVLEKLGDGPGRIVAILEVPERVKAVRALVPSSIKVVGSTEDLASLPPLAAECAGHKAVATYCVGLLKRGIDVIVISAGSLSAPGLFDELKASARHGKAKLMLPAGAIPGADALAAARIGGLDYVRYTSRKPPMAWKGTPAETVVDLASVKERTVLFKGRADEASQLYPQNANVATTTALAGLGFDKTEVLLTADPAAKGNIHLIEAGGAFGEMRLEIAGKPLPNNPKTSSLAAYSLVRAIRNRCGNIEI
ncbi:MAG: aspartate dehydrogenase [Alphaproteobacteria bacterium]|nr:aspartate dehydrogenase [Alphaproteobacteria bacterium]